VALPTVTMEGGSSERPAGCAATDAEKTRQAAAHRKGTRDMENLQEIRSAV
jgi:hypothetical protein